MGEQQHYEYAEDEPFTKRELKVIFAAMQWNPDVAAIDCDNDEFDEVLRKVQQAAGLNEEEEGCRARIYSKRIQSLTKLDAEG